MPFAVVIARELFVTLQLMVGASIMTKCDKALLSAIDIERAGGPTLDVV
jgi:hypothetical protein